jgi:hypothetical protein
MRPRLLPVASLLAAVLVASCIGKDAREPGTAIGTFAVTGTLKANSCGSAAPNPWTFSVKLSKDPGTLYWDQGDYPVAGDLTASNTVTMTSTSTQSGGASSGSSTCTLQRVDKLSTALTPDPTLAGSYSSFTGTLEYDFSTPAGSGDCSSALAANGGGYATLPCSMTYALTASRTALPNAYGK